MELIKIEKIPNAIEDYIGMCKDIEDRLFYSFYSEKSDNYKMVSIESDENPQELMFSDYEDLAIFFDTNSFEMCEVRIIVE